MAPRKTIHPSMERLLQAARDATAGERHPVMDYADIAKRLDVSSAVMTNWKARGLSERGALQAQRLFGCSANWLIRGESDRPGTKPSRPLPLGDMPDDRKPTDSEWDLLEDIQTLPLEEREALKQRIRADAEKYRRYAAQVLASLKPHRTR